MGPYANTYTEVETIMQLCQAFVIIGVLGFLGITAAFESDNGSTCNYGPCRKFMSPASRSTAGNNIDQGEQWGAQEGWFLTLATIPVSILLLIVVVLNKFPIPVDSVGSGEAL